MPDPEQRDAHALGERRHEQCRHGTFSDEAYIIDARTGAETPIADPLCAWSPTETWPPQLSRLWGNGVDFRRDCAVCACFSPLE